MPIDEREVTIAANQFVRTRPDFAEYNIRANTDAMAAKIIETWGEAGLENASCWEIIFAELKDSLVRNPNYVSREFAKRANSMPVDEMKRAYRNEPGFAEQWDRLARQEIPLEAITNDAWIGLTAETYNAIDEAERRRLYNTDFNFRKNVQRIAAGGESNG